MSKKQKNNNASVDYEELGIRLLTSEQVAKKLAISLPTLKKIRENGTYHGMTPPPYIMLGKSERSGIRYIEQELDKWILSLPRYTSTAHSNS